MFNPLLRSNKPDRAIIRRGVAVPPNRLVSKDRGPIGRETFVAVMQAIDLREGDDSSDAGRRDRARVRTILVE